MRDRFEKRGFYQKLPAVNHLIFIALDRMDVEHLVRQSEGIWQQRTHDTPDSMLMIDALELSIPLADIYAGVL